MLPVQENVETHSGLSGEFESDFGAVFDRAASFGEIIHSGIASLHPPDVSLDQMPESTVWRLHLMATASYEASIQWLRTRYSSLGGYIVLRGLLEAWAHLDFIADDSQSGSPALRAIRYEQGAPAPSRQQPAEGGEDCPIYRAVGDARIELAFEDTHLVAEHHDLDVLGPCPSRSAERIGAGRGPGTGRGNRGVNAAPIMVAGVEHCQFRAAIEVLVPYTSIERSENGMRGSIGACSLSSTEPAPFIRQRSTRRRHAHPGAAQLRSPVRADASHRSRNQPTFMLGGVHTSVLRHVVRAPSPVRDRAVLSVQDAQPGELEGEFLGGLLVQIDPKPR